MGYVFSSNSIGKKEIAFVYGKGEFSGVVKLANTVADDMNAVFGKRPEVIEGCDQSAKKPVVFGTLGQSELIDNIAKEGKLKIEKIEGKRECYIIKQIGEKLVIAGSDKRGTIYGLFRLSEMMGVSPLIGWMDIQPKKMKSFSIKDNYEYVSKEPSVRFRGFFINDEWPAFGNFTFHKYGGFNAKSYVHVFELLLRLKGNYLWPAMWSSVFSTEGPDLESAILADEMGVIMGASHHEPCLRYGEEYKRVRGKDSIYGDAWNFLTNEKGITKFWEDGLKRSGKFENVVTVGMRGEADTAIMGKESTLKDNIDLLRKVLKTQNSLIKKYVNDDLDEVPRMLALYKEVEPYFYGDENTKGLMDDPELEGVTLMLCDDNHGNLRTVPTEHMRSHKGGYGMYYHFDYHGLPRSFEWLNTSYLPKVWEQMTTAYDFGIRDLWIVNVGDIFSNEYPLSFFLDMAYDFEKWGTSNSNSAKEYTKLFVKKNFGDKVTTAEANKIVSLLLGYTKLTGRRRTEAMNEAAYEPFAFGECENTLKEVDKLISQTEAFHDSLKGNVKFAFYELVYVPLVGNLNVQKMWLLTTLNNGYARFGSTAALGLVDKISECIDKDHKIVDELHKIHSEKWYGMGLSEHIGFNNWGEEECYYPIVHTFNPANKLRLIVSIPETNQHTEGKIWTGTTLTLGSFLDPACNKGRIALTTASAKPIEYTVENDYDFITLSKEAGKATPNKVSYLTVTVDREKFAKAKLSECPKILITAENGNGNDITKVPVRIPINVLESMEAANEPNTFLWCGEGEVDLGVTMDGMPSFTRVNPEGTLQYQYVSIEAEHFASKNEGKNGASFELIPGYGKTLSAMKAYPQDVNFGNGKGSPSISYKMVLPEDGKYVVRVYTNPSNPCGSVQELYFGVKANDGKAKKVNMIPEGYVVGDGNMPWQWGVVDQIRITDVTLDMKAGVNELTFNAVSPNFVLEKIVVFKEGCEPIASNLGPNETYYVK